LRHISPDTPVFGSVFHSPIGPISLQCTEDQVIALHFGARNLRDRTPLLTEAEAQLRAYFSGELRNFQLPLFYQGTLFQKRVWDALQQIPFGSTISYHDLAEAIDAPRAFRAVGGANGKNPLPILIPCHRVIAHDGALGGYSGGLAIKKALLSLEGLSFSSNNVAHRKRADQ